VKKKVEKIVGYGYVGRWMEGGIGWAMPAFLHSDNTIDKPEEPVTTNYTSENDFAELCRITIEVVPGARRRRMKKAKP